jgi:hypothetical protein
MTIVSQPPAGPGQRGCLIVFVGLLSVLALCLGSCALMIVGPPELFYSRLPLGYWVQACIGLNTTGRVQFGIAWIAPYISATIQPVLFWPQHSCRYIPWLPVLPVRGEFVFPP